MDYIPDVLLLHCVIVSSGKVERCTHAKNTAKKQNWIELNCLWQYSRYAILIINSHPIFVCLYWFFLAPSTDFAGFWLDFLLFFRMIPFVCSFFRFVYSFIRHMCTISMHHSHIFYFVVVAIIALDLYFPSHFRHANSHTLRQFFYSIPKTLNIRCVCIIFILAYFFFTEKNAISNKKRVIFPYFHNWK